MWITLIFFLGLGRALSADMDDNDDSSRKILGSSVVTSVSVILDSGNGNKATFSDAVGKPVLKPQVAKLASPIELLNPDRYEFYTFDESGDLVKRLMTMEEIKAIIATSGDDVFNIDNFSDIIPENRVNDIVSNVQNVLREEIEAHKMPDTNQLFDTPDVSDSWSMILPAIFGNSGEQIKPEKTPTASTPETLVIGPTQTEATTTESINTGTTKPSPLSYFPNYFSQNTAITKVKSDSVTEVNSVIPFSTSTSKLPNSTQRVSTNELFISQPSTQVSIFTKIPNKIPTTTGSTTLKVQIYPNSNTNSEGTFNTLTTRGTSSDSEYVRIRTPQPQPLLESRVSSTILEETSPSIISKTSGPTTSKLYPTLAKGSSNQLTHPFTQSSTPMSNSATTSTVEYTKQLVALDVSTEKLTSLTNFKPTTEKEHGINRTAIPEVVSHDNIRTTSEPTEKIYILLRPLTSTSTTESSTSYSKHMVDQTSSMISTNSRNDFETTDPNEISSSQSIFTIIPENPAIVSVPVLSQETIIHETEITEPSTPKVSLSTSQPITHQTDLEENKKTNIFSTQINNAHSITMSGLEKPSFNMTTQSSLQHGDNNSVFVTLAEIFNDKNSSYNDNFSNYTEQTLQNVTAFHKQMNDTKTAAFSELQNTGSIFNNQYTSNKDSVSELPTTYSTESETENSKTASTIINDVEKTESVSSHNELQKDLLEKLLLSSTNVYEINSAVNQELTYPVETTLFSENSFTELPNFKNVSAVEVNPTLIESFEQLLAQAVANISDVAPKKNETSNYHHRTDITDFTTTSKFETYDLSTKLHDSTTYLPNHESTRSPIFVELIEETDDKTPETTENIFDSTIPVFNKFNNFEEEHLINISIFRKQNSTKPAKADLSLEVDYDLLSSNHTNIKKLTPTMSITSTEPSTIQESTPKVDDSQTDNSFMNKSDSTPQEDYYTLIASDQSTHSYSEYTTEPEQKMSTVKIIALPLTPSSETTLNTGLYSMNVNKAEDTWTLVSTIAPHGKIPTLEKKPTLAPILEPTPTVDFEVNPMQGFGLEESTANLDPDVYHFVQLCNELAFGFWKSVTTGLSTARSVIVSPFAATSLLAMVFLGARGSTSGEMNEILKLDNMVTFNPHLTFKTVTESILTGPDFGVATSAIVRQLYSDKSKEKILNFYKERARFFYDGHVEEVSFKAVGDTIRRRTNLLIKKQTNGKIQEFLKDGSVKVRSPLAAISGSVMQTDCSKGSITDRDGEIHFVVFPSIKQRRLVPIPAIVYRKGFLAGYEPSLDATAVALGEKDDIISFIFVLPGQQGINALGDGLSRLEKRLVESSFQKGAWGRLLRTLVPRPELEVQIPRFSHRSIINATAALKQMGLTTLFDINKADLRGLNGVAHDLHLSDMLQFNQFSLCGNTNSAHGHHSEYYPATARRSLRRHRRLDHFEQQKILHDDPLYIINYLSLPLNLRPRQARVPQVPRLRLDRPFLYFVRHNPTGFILHMGRFNPRLLP